MHIYAHSAGCSSQFESLTTPLGRHINLNEGQYVVPWLNFSCSGNITAWEFAASVQDRRMPDKQVILQLWQPLPNNINPTSPSQFAFITEVVLSTSVEGTFNQERPFSFDLTQPLPVQSGNVLGFSVLNPRTGVRFAAVTASAMEERLIYYRQTGGTSRRRGRERGDDGPEDDLEDETEDSSEVTLFNINSNVNTIAGPHSPLMTIRFSTGNSAQGMNLLISLSGSCMCTKCCMNMFIYICIIILYLLDVERETVVKSHFLTSTLMRAT